MAKRALLLVAFLVGCGRMKDALNPERVEKREAAARQQREADAARWREQRAQEDAKAKREADADAACLTAESPQLIRLCDAREREKDRNAQQRQWDRENEMREHRLELDRQSREIERETARRAAIQRSFQPPPSVNCTSVRTGDYVNTHCY